jgi:hypothetical protein
VKEGGRKKREEEADEFKEAIRNMLSLIEVWVPSRIAGPIAFSSTNLSQSRTAASSHQQ